MPMFTLSNASRLFLCLALGCAVLNLGGRSLAQQSSNAPDAGQAPASDNELRAFVKAYVDNQQIRQKYEPALKDGTDPTKDQELQDRANAELKQSLAKQNLTIERYNSIYNRVNADEGLRNKVLKLVEEERKKAATKVPL
jgi:hypothetical protein